MRKYENFTIKFCFGIVLYIIYMCGGLSCSSRLGLRAAATGFDGFYELDVAFRQIKPYILLH